jgi:hypothetical protein
MHDTSTTTIAYKRIKGIFSWPILTNTGNETTSPKFSATITTTINALKHSHLHQNYLHGATASKKSLLLIDKSNQPHPPIGHIK